MGNLGVETTAKQVVYVLAGRLALVRIGQQGLCQHLQLRLIPQRLAGSLKQGDGTRPIHLAREPERLDLCGQLAGLWRVELTQLMGKRDQTVMLGTGRLPLGVGVGVGERTNAELGHSGYVGGTQLTHYSCDPAYAVEHQLMFKAGCLFRR